MCLQQIKHSIVECLLLWLPGVCRVFVWEIRVEQKNKSVRLCVIISIDQLYLEIHWKAISLKKPLSPSLPISLDSSALPLRSPALYPSNKARSHRSAVSVAKGECSYHLISLTYHLHAHKIQLETSLSSRSTMCNCSFVQRWLANWLK